MCRLAPSHTFKAMYNCLVIYLAIRHCWLCLPHTDAFRQKHCYESDQIPLKKRITEESKEKPPNLMKRKSTVSSSLFYHNVAKLKQMTLNWGGKGVNGKLF